MSSISVDEVARVAALARIELSPEAIAKLAGDLDVIVESVAQVSAVPADVPATSHPLPISNVFRPDVPERPLTVEQALSGAPASQDDRFLVPQILGEE
ncbi:Asp-tRNA(Asn)/Glu-tRNA(Gln) amidotransferase subunit GatC [Rarobacter incanus]|uniref:Aspartyl/glutamyl-tRNA(Asn/Gln) amidotransferase subunit C n=1 Tax=Rarobacter incanus TaxID=153494 RepID=A0A542SND5_9MICO|nr:Asp-tRNA(Asn)/Glu-tRNA(Gln) amidotransferase subunit GatC [Rarobacter incanus]TQK76068.1 aspartyl/glutamyl-tRNA(Asn/Gln) amidotransferase subunit C [Rarobacter incanus]